MKPRLWRGMQGKLDTVPLLDPLNFIALQFPQHEYNDNASEFLNHAKKKGRH